MNKNQNKQNINRTPREQCQIW